ncbi:MAG: N-acetylmuramoyl-L-alanine amidase [Jhaorihella sp.]
MSGYMKSLQAALEGLGWGPGPIDGVFGPATAAAAAAFAGSERGVPPTPEPAPPIGKRLAIVVGHTLRAPGATRVVDGVPEYEWNMDLADRIRRYALQAGVDCSVFLRDENLGYAAQIEKVYGKADSWGADATVELHFNASSVASATGTETLHSGSARSKAFASAVQGRMLAALGLRSRGTFKPAVRGLKSLITGRAPAILIEPYFGSNPKDCAAADGGKDQLASAIIEGFLEAF